MRLAQFITGNLEEILLECEAFAESLLVPGQVLTPSLRDHAAQVRLAVAALTESIANFSYEAARSLPDGAMPTTSEPVNVAQLCRIAFDEIRAAHPKRNFRLETSGTLEGRFDRERLQQALSNMLNNAVRHGVGSQPITLSAHGEADKVTVQVKNYGRRIPPDQRLVIFNPRVQIPPALINEDKAGTVFSARLPRTPAAILPTSRSEALWLLPATTASRAGRAGARSRSSPPNSTRRNASRGPDDSAR